MRRELLLVSMAFAAAFVAAQISAARAAQPQVMNVEVVTEEGHLVLYARIWNLWSTQDHYTDIVEFNVNGVSDFVYLYTPREDAIDVRHDTGLTGGPITVQVRAHCMGHSWGEWSDPETIPEFPLIHVFLPFAALTTMASLLKSRLSVRSGKYK